MILLLRILVLIGSIFLLFHGDADTGKQKRKTKDQDKVAPSPDQVKPRRPLLPFRDFNVEAGDLIGADECDPTKHSVDLPSEIRAWYRNPDGSCVQCSIGMIGVDQNIPNAALLLWPSEYGKAERGGSYPQRVAAYAEKRGLRIYNVTGLENTMAWMKWACKTGRGAAIGAGGSHFQTLFGYVPATGKWYVCNNNSTGKIDEYTEDGFKRLHLASGPWAVFLDAPAHPWRAEYIRWWE